MTDFIRASSVMLLASDSGILQASNLSSILAIDVQESKSVSARYVTGSVMVASTTCSLIEFPASETSETFSFWQPMTAAPRTNT